MGDQESEVRSIRALAYQPNLWTWKTSDCDYLAGLFEGDGHISISKPDAKVKNLSLSITFNLKDLPLAERLKTVSGHG